jgi:hypothetical protein
MFPCGHEHPWKPAVNGGSKRPWFVIREGWWNGQRGARSVTCEAPIEERYQWRKDGRSVRYASQAAAEDAAERLNRAERLARVR